jgi:tripartite-type tricarboxylate transporter receptor subunit TctC
MLQAHATENIVIASPYSPSHSGTPAMFRIIDEANKSQSKYNFILEFKPGGEQIIAINYLDQAPKSRLAIIAPKFVEHVLSAKLKQEDYVPIHALGDACWAVISNIGNAQQGISSLNGIKELIVGGVGVGNAAHITSLELAEKFNFKVTYIPFRSNFDALVLLFSDQSINLVLERVHSYNQYKEKNNKVSVLAMNCPTRHPEMPNTKTLYEQGIEAPYIFNITVAHKNMPVAKRNEIENLLNIATLKVGRDEIYKLSDMVPPVFNNLSTRDYYTDRFNFMHKMLKKHQIQINSN